MDHLLSGFTDEIVKIAKEERGKDGGFGLLEAGMVAATLSPFVGQIGEQNIIHDPHIAKNIMRVTDAASLDRLARPGDIVVMSKKFDPDRHIQRAFSGADWSHVQPVVGLRDGKATTVSAGHYNRRVYKALSRGEFLDKIMTLSEDMKANNYTDAVILRPRKPLSPSQLNTFVSESLSRARLGWDGGSGAKGFLVDIFKPKRMVSEGDLKKINSEMLIRYGEIVDPKSGQKIRVPMVCKGNTCSGLSAQAMKASTGTGVIAGKRPSSILPADFLRSKKYQPVGALINSTKLPSKFLPHIARGGLGAGLAYGLYKTQKSPEYIGAAGGVLAATALQALVTKRIGRAMGLSVGQANRKIPNLMKAMQRTVSATSTLGRVSPILKYLALGTPAKVLGGLAALRVGRVIMNRDEEENA